jgi:glucose-6-phosphate 1-epimerase
MRVFHNACGRYRFRPGTLVRFLPSSITTGIYMNVSELNGTYGIAGSLTFAPGHGGLPNAVLTCGHGEVVVSLYGAHVLSYRPRGKSEVFWMSALSEFSEGKPIRGGIPVCFPWFGPHATDAQKPQHGFARLHIWTVAGASVLPDGGIELRLTLTDTQATMALWPHSFAAELTVTLTSSLEVRLRCTNTGDAAFTYSDALHSYFAVSDIANVKIHGLSGAKFLEAKGNEQHRQNEELLEIRGEVNRRYIGTTSECIIEDAGMPRKIRVGKKGSTVTVVWNPWKDTAKQIADMPDDGYKTMICVEAVNAFDDVVTLEPQASFSVGTVITVQEQAH